MSKPKGKYMFEKFDEIRNASREYFGPDDGRVLTSAEAVNELMSSKDLGLNVKGARLIEALPKSDLIELTGIMFYGSSAVVRSDNRREVLEQTIRRYAYMVDDKGHATYLSEKPLHKHLAAAEAKLRGERDEPELDEEET